MKKADRDRLEQELSVVRRQSQAIMANRARRQSSLAKPAIEDKALKRGFLERLKFWGKA